MVGLPHGFDLLTSAGGPLERAHGQTTGPSELGLDTDAFHAALSANTTASAGIPSFNGATTTNYATHAGPSQPGQEALVVSSAEQFRPATPHSETMRLYANPSHLPPGIPIEPGIWRYGTSLYLRGGRDAKEGFDAIRSYGAASHEGRKVLATIDWSPGHTYVRPYKHAPGVRDHAHRPASNWVRSNDPSKFYTDVQFGVDQGGLGANGAKVPPAVLALHELAHAANAEHGEPLKGIGAGLFENAEEFRALNIEREVQERHEGLPRNIYHYSKLYQTNGITSSVPRDPRVGALFEHMKPVQRKLAHFLDAWVDKFNPPQPVEPAGLEPTTAAETVGMIKMITELIGHRVIELEQQPMPSVTPAAIQM